MAEFRRSVRPKKYRENRYCENAEDDITGFSAPYSTSIIDENGLLVNTRDPASIDNPNVFLGDQGTHRPFRGDNTDTGGNT